MAVPDLIVADFWIDFNLDSINVYNVDSIIPPVVEDNKHSSLKQVSFEKRFF